MKRAKTETTDPKQAAPEAAAPAPAAPREPERLERIPLNCLVPSPNNPRKIDPADPALAELAESIRANGLLQPAVVRPISTVRNAVGLGASYEILAGERRFEAHKLLTAPDMLCIVRVMDDDAALRVTVLENLQRADLTPLEEAVGVKALLAGGHTPEDIAVEIGKTPAWVARRARLTELIPEARKALIENESTIQQMLAVAALPAPEQKWAIGRDWMLDPQRTQDLLYEIAERQMKLAAAPFPVDLSFKGGFPACTECQKRTGCNPLLFGDDQEPSKDDRCLDPGCWEAKVKIWLEQALEEARRDHPGIILAKTECGDMAHEKMLHVGTKDWDDGKICKKGAPDAKPAFVAYGPRLGQVVWVKVKKESAAAVKAAANRGADGKPIPPKPHERQRTLHQKRCAWMVNLFVESVACNLGEFFEKMEPGKLLNVLMAFGCSQNTGSDTYRLGDAWKHYAAIGGDAGPCKGDLEQFYVKHVAPVFKQRVRFEGLHHAERAFVEAAQICRLLGYRLFTDHYTACMKSLPVPRSWGNIPDPWAPAGEIKDPFDPVHEQHREFKAPPAVGMPDPVVNGAVVRGKRRVKREQD